MEKTGLEGWSWLAQNSRRYFLMQISFRIEHLGVFIHAFLENKAMCMNSLHLYGIPCFSKVKRALSMLGSLSLRFWNQSKHSNPKSVVGNLWGWDFSLASGLVGLPPLKILVLDLVQSCEPLMPITILSRVDQNLPLNCFCERRLAWRYP